MAFTPEVQARIQILRAKALDNTITQEELREAIQLLRADRFASASASAKGKAAKAAKSAPVDADALLNELEGML